MKKHISVLLFCISLLGCETLKNYQFTDLQITGVTTLGARAALLLVPASKQALVKKWMFYVATRLRTLTGNPSATDVSNLLLGSIPAADLNLLPELKTVIIPEAVSLYTTLSQKYSGYSLIKILNDVATGFESAAST